MLGNALQLRSHNLHLVAERWCREYGSIVRFDLGPRPCIGVGDQATINDVLRRRPDEFGRWREIEEGAVEMGSKGVFAAEGDEWRRWRRLAVTALNSNHLRRYYDVVRVATERLRERLVTHARTGRPVAISEEFKTFTMDVTVALAFGCDLATDGREAQLRQTSITSSR